MALSSKSLTRHNVLGVLREGSSLADRMEKSTSQNTIGHMLMLTSDRSILGSLDSDTLSQHIRSRTMTESLGHMKHVHYCKGR